jgi:hypothetical protein
VKNIAGITTLSTPVLFDPDGSAANGWGQVVLSSFPAPTTISYSYTETAVANAFATIGPPFVPHNTLTKTYMIDPAAFTVGNVNSTVHLTEELDAGTQLERPALGVIPEVVVEARFGLGDFTGDAAAFWASPAPANTFDVYKVRVFENAGSVDAAVDFLGPPVSGYSFAYSATEAAIENAIRTASWTLSGGAWTLNSDLIVADVVVTSLDQANSGKDITLGIRASVEAIEAVPEPSSAGVLAIAAGCLVARKRRRMF